MCPTCPRCKSQQKAHRALPSFISSSTAPQFCTYSVVAKEILWHWWSYFSLQINPHTLTGRICLLYGHNVPGQFLNVTNSLSSENRVSLLHFGSVHYSLERENGCEKQTMAASVGVVLLPMLKGNPSAPESLSQKCEDCHCLIKKRCECSFSFPKCLKE